MITELPIKVEPLPLEEVDQMEKNDFLDAINGLVIKKFQENGDKDNIEITLDDIKNAAAMEEINKKNIELIRNFFEQKGITVDIDGEHGKECFQFTMPLEKAI